MVISKQIVESLSKSLRLNYQGKEQDWDIELADADRVEEFIGFASDSKLSNVERYAVLSLILASFDDRLNLVGSSDNSAVWQDIIHLLDKNVTLYKDLLGYWAVETAKILLR